VEADAEGAALERYPLDTKPAPASDRACRAMRLDLTWKRPAGQSLEPAMRNVLLGGSRLPWRCLRLAAYYVSILLVFSFICCEVLDLDGSDFPVPSKSPRISLAESQQDLRRAIQPSEQPWGPALSAANDDHGGLLKADDVEATAPTWVPVARRSPLTLPRAAPDDPPA
jgi:hypothetical protein